MAGQQRGDLVLERIPTNQIERRVVNYLLKLRQGSSRKALAARIKETPTVLFKDISAARGCMIAGELKTLGAVVFFVPYLPEEEPEPEQTSTETVNPAPEEQVRAYQPPKRKKRKFLKLLTLLFFLVILAALIIKLFRPSLLFPRWEIFSKEASYSSLFPLIDPSPYFPDRARNPSILECSPVDLYNTFLNQYRLRPDLRFLKAFEILADRFEDYQGKQPGPRAYRAGEILSNGKEILIPLLKEGQQVSNIRLSLPLTFPAVISALNQWIEFMEGPRAVKVITLIQEEDLKVLETADQEIVQLDPRTILFALKKLEHLRARIGPDARIFRSAARAYALLGLILFPDPLDAADLFTAEALSYLSLAKRFDPKLPLTREEALLASVMGYRTYGQHLLSASEPGATNNLDSKILLAFVRKDLPGLKSLEGTGNRLQGSYFLLRLCREISLVDEADQRADKIIEEYPSFYPALTEILLSGNLETAKAVAWLYPKDILDHLDQGFSEETFKLEKPWKERIRDVLPEQSNPLPTLTQFETFLQKWRPLGPDKGRGMIIDDQRVKLIFRTLYAGALFLKFQLHHNRAEGADQTQRTLDTLAAKDKDHPLILRMQALALKKNGKTKEADNLCAKLIHHANASPTLITGAYTLINDFSTRLGLAKTVSQKLDGRPAHFFFWGRAFQKLTNLDLAEKFFSLGLNQDPYQSINYVYLAEVTGRDDPLALALANYPDQIALLEEAGRYYAQKDDSDSKEKALKYFDRALKHAPSKTSLILEKINILKQLNRLETAVNTIKSWLKEYGKPDSALSVFRTQLAEIYLQMRKPKPALEAVSKELASNQIEALFVSAKAHEILGQRKQAEEIYKKIVTRSPLSPEILARTAAYYWRQGRDEEAAFLISQQRKNSRQSSSFYFKEFFELFDNSSVDRIKKAATPLSKEEAGIGELNNLALQFERRKRPEVAFMLLQDFQPTAFGGQLEHFLITYKVLKNWKGNEEAARYLTSRSPGQTKIPLLVGLSKYGFFDLILNELQDPKTYSPALKEFFWLQRLIAWLAQEKKPARLEEEFQEHYQEKWLDKLSGNKKSDQYRFIGQFLRGMIPLQIFLGQIQTPKQRCLFSYFIGLAERLKSNYQEATLWYHIALETQFQNNDEFQKAQEELFLWTQVGLKNRNRLWSHDQKAALQSNRL